MSETSDSGEDNSSGKPDQEKNSGSEQSSATKKEDDSNYPAPKDNVWKFATIGLASLLLILSLATIISPGMLTGAACEGGVKDTIAAQKAADRAVNYLNKNLIQRGAAEVNVANEISGVYAVNTSYQGSTLPIYVSKDGKYLFLKGIKLTGNNLTKTEKPQADLFIFSYCPAGSSALDSFAPVGKLLGQEAEMNVKFFSNMHGEHELQQNKIQLCIQENYEDKYWDYANKFVERVYDQCAQSRSASCDKNKSVALMRDVGIDADKVMSCVEEKGQELYQSNKQQAKDLQLQYSPSFVINGKYLKNIDRSPEGIKKEICSAFNQKPEDCSQTVNSNSTAVGGGC